MDKIGVMFLLLCFYSQCVVECIGRIGIRSNCLIVFNGILDFVKICMYVICMPRGPSPHGRFSSYHRRLDLVSVYNFSS